MPSAGGRTGDRALGLQSRGKRSNSPTKPLFGCGLRGETGRSVNWNLQRHDAVPATRGRPSLTPQTPLARGIWRLPLRGLAARPPGRGPHARGRCQNRTRAPSGFSASRMKKVDPSTFQQANTPGSTSRFRADRFFSGPTSRVPSGGAPGAPFSRTLTPESPNPILLCDLPDGVGAGGALDLDAASLPAP